MSMELAATVVAIGPPIGPSDVSTVLQQLERLLNTTTQSTTSKRTVITNLKSILQTVLLPELQKRLARSEDVSALEDTVWAENLSVMLQDPIAVQPEDWNGFFRSCTNWDAFLDGVDGVVARYAQDEPGMMRYTQQMATIVVHGLHYIGELNTLRDWTTNWTATHNAYKLQAKSQVYRLLYHILKIYAQQVKERIIEVKIEENASILAQVSATLSAEAKERKETGGDATLWVDIAQLLLAENTKTQFDAMGASFATSLALYQQEYANLSTLGTASKLYHKIQEMSRTIDLALHAETSGDRQITSTSSTSDSKMDESTQ
jgi:hypothetical protein